MIRSVARACFALLLLSASLFSRADDKASAGPDFSKGLLCGRVIDAMTGKPLPDATVAVQDKDGKVLAWTKTDSNGKYSLAADTLKVLNLQPSRRRGLLDEIVRGVGQVVSAPVKVAEGVVDTVKRTSPIETVKNAAISTATGNPLPLTAQIVNTAAGPVKDAAKTAPTEADRQTKVAAVRTVFGERLAAKEAKKAALSPGEVFLAVSRPEYKGVKGKAGTYWLEPPVPADKRSKEDKGKGVLAWMETVKLAPSAAADKRSEIVNEAILLGDAKLEPALIPAGGTVKIAVKAQRPGEPAARMRVFAREDKKRTLVELKPQENGVYSGELVVDPKCPSGDTKVTIAALREEPIDVNLPKGKEDPLLLLAKRLDDLDADKPYDYDPKILASENRLDLTLTVLDPKQRTPPAQPKRP